MKEKEIGNMIGKERKIERAKGFRVASVARWLANMLVIYESLFLNENFTTHCPHSAWRA